MKNTHIKKAAVTAIFAAVTATFLYQFGSTKAAKTLGIDVGRDSLNASTRLSSSKGTDGGDLLLSEKYRNKNDSFVQLNLEIGGGDSLVYKNWGSLVELYLAKHTGVDATTYGIQTSVFRYLYKSQNAKVSLGGRIKMGIGWISNKGEIIKQKHEVNIVSAIMGGNYTSKDAPPVSRALPDNTAIFETSAVLNLGVQMSSGLNISAFWGLDSKTLQNSTGFSEFRDKGNIGGPTMGVSLKYSF